jgi:hypothetical protein
MRRTKKIMDEITITSLIDAYHTELKDKTAWRYIGDYIEITTPYLDHNNDYIQLYIEKIEDGYLLGDGGSTISALEADYSPSSPEFKRLLKLALADHGISLVNDNLQVTATADNFACRMHLFIQAVLAVDYLFYLDHRLGHDDVEDAEDEDEEEIPKNSHRFPLRFSTGKFVTNLFGS